MFFLLNKIIGNRPHTIKKSNLPLWTFIDFYSQNNSAGRGPAELFILILFDYLQAFSVCEYSNEDQEYNTLDQLHCLRRHAHHSKTVIEHCVQQRAYDDIFKTNLCAAGNRHSAQNQRDQNLCLQLVAYVCGSGAVLYNIDKRGDGQFGYPQI